MHRAVTALALSAGLIAAGAPQAAAAPPGPTPTHDEYIAQVDPICQSFVGPVNGALSSYSRSIKRMNRLAKRVIRLRKSGNPKAFRKSVRAFLRATRRTAGSLNALAQIHASMIAQIDGVIPPPEGAVFTWLRYLREEQSWEAAAAAALLQLKIKQFLYALNQAASAQAAARGAISGYGFQVCGVSV